MEKVRELFQKIPTSYYLPILLLLCGSIVFGIGLIQFLGSHHDTEVLPVSTQDVSATVSAQSAFGLIKVDIEGAVVHPGVYAVQSSARIQDVLIAAGGLSENADRKIVEQRINLAAKLTDGMKIYIPDISEKGSVGSASSDYSGGQVHLIDLNSATLSELDSLPGIGPVTAQKIIDARPFASVNELLSKKVIANNIYEKIKTLVTTY